MHPLVLPLALTLSLQVAAAQATAAVDEAALASRCARGFPVECRELGRARLAGEALPRDDRLAAAYLTQACEMGDPAACSDLGVLYAIGRGLPQSDERATALVRRACEQGAAIACSNQGALMAEGVGGPPPKALAGEDAGAPMIRLFRRACEAGVPEGCANLGGAFDGGKLAARDVRIAARSLRRACDAGLALACHRLSLLLQERPEVVPDLTAVALETRACHAGIAPACYTVSEKTPPPGSRTPAGRLVDDPRSFALGIPGTGGFTPGELTSRAGAGGRAKRVLADLRRPPEALRAAVPEPLRARLGVDQPAAPIVAADPAVEVLLALRHGQLGECYEAPRAQAAVRTETFAVLHLDGDGHAAELHVASAPADPALDECVRGVVEGWEFPASEEGHSGPFLVRFAFDAAPGPAAAFAGPGFLRPALRDAGCVERKLQVPAEYRGSTGTATVKLAVDLAGKPGLVHRLSPVPDEIVAAVADAVRACPWSVGGDADGRPTPLWTTVTVKLDAR
ncbi:MAG TPA: tetratricopeptide repeat protein [Anaeromyxobacter sp.]